MATPKGRKKKEPYRPEPYQVNPDICVQFELQYKKDLIKPGTKLRFKNRRGTFSFRQLAHNMVLDVTWIDVIDQDGGWRSFYVNELKGVVKPKRSRRHKANT